MPSLDPFEGFCKPLVVILQFWRPFLAIIGGSIVPSHGRRLGNGIPILFPGGQRRRSILARLYAGIRGGLAENLHFQALLSRRAEESFPRLFADGRPWESRQILPAKSAHACKPDSHFRRSFSRHTSNDCAYQSCTLLIEGISFKPSGRSPSSCTRWAKRMGSSSDRNCDARNSVPGRTCQPCVPGLLCFELINLSRAAPQIAPSALGSLPWRESWSNV